MQKPTTIKLDGHSYIVQYLSSSQAIEVATEVGAALLPALAKALPKGLKRDVSFMDQDIDLGGGLESLATVLKPAKMLELVKQLCSVVVAEGEGLLDGAIFEEHFKGRPGAALRVAAKSYEVNCGDFFASAVSLVGLTKTAASAQGQAA